MYSLIRSFSSIFISSFDGLVRVSRCGMSCLFAHRRPSAVSNAGSSQDRSSIDILELNCCVIDEKEPRVFQVEIARSKTISALKKAIKEEKKKSLQDVDADTLDLWKVSFFDLQLTNKVSNAESSSRLRSPTTVSTRG